MPTQGLAAQLHGKPIQPLCLELVDIARHGLQKIADEKSVALLDPLRDYVAAGRCPADDILDAFHAAGGDAVKFVRAIQIRL